MKGKEGRKEGRKEGSSQFAFKYLIALDLI
jgi:hypothetical protein